MEKIGDEVFVLNSLCRICFGDCENLIGIFSSFGKENNFIDILNAMEVNVTEADPWSLFVCDDCARRLADFHQFKLLAKETQLKFEAYREQDITTTEEVVSEHSIIEYQEDSFNECILEDEEEEIIKYCDPDEVPLVESDIEIEYVFGKIDKTIDARYETFEKELSTENNKKGRKSLKPQMITVHVPALPWPPNRANSRCGSPSPQPTAAAPPTLHLDDWLKHNLEYGEGIVSQAELCQSPSQNLAQLGRSLSKAFPLTRQWTKIRKNNCTYYKGLRFKKK